MSKTCHNCFSIGLILSKNVLVRKKHSVCLYSKKHFVSVSVSHKISSHLAKHMLFLCKKSILFAKCDEILWETDTLTKCFLEYRQTECFFLTKTFFDNIRPIEKKVMTGFRHRVKERSQRGRSSR